MSVEVGERLIIAKHRASVRYVGPVEGQEGTWVGVEWDDPSRGKHDGTTGGRRYFSCSCDSPTAASFVRISKVSRGSSVVDALVQRYTNQLAEGQAAADGQVFLHTSSHRKVWVELVGEQKVTERLSKTELLQAARLVGANASHVGPAGALAAAAPNLVQLDLTDNLLSSWGSVAQICSELPQLRVLQLSNNRLALPCSMHSGGPDAVQVLLGLQCLVLNQCSISWQQVGVLQRCLPNLLELHVAGNNINSLRLQLDLQEQQQQHAAELQQPSAGQPQQQQQQQQQCDSSGVDGSLAGFKSLQVLGLEDNAIADWAEVLRLAGLPQLRRLHLSGNPIASIAYPAHSIGLDALASQQPPAAAALDKQQQQGQQQQQQPYGQLEALLLGNCRISSWADVDALNLLPRLAELRLSGNPLFDAEAGAAGGGRRYEVIGRVAGLTLLNGADVKPRERRDCELRYLQTILADAQQQQQQQQQQQSQAELQRQHPRLAELQAKYGQVIAAAAAKPSQQGSSLSSTTCELTLRHGNSSSKKKLPKTITIAALKLLCGRLFKLPPDQQQLLLHVPETGEEQQQQQQQGEDIGQDDTKNLAFWDVVDGCAVEVLHVDVEQQRAAAAAVQLSRQQQHEQRMAQQLQQGDALRSVAER
ncbi:hypothetical protein OEZ85_010201 [Tetradesmus obliquus]|uniref:CAP-Gly domain-containing protein n=1 Tax=Tetradesmus obliquus TaxID=3088 RepID=A0ABY8TLJ9_TETOB|nr:hypothetical protein OEZ85_010201 [Tetradesmus obliquus]